ncbi:DUF4279 domain-containing protein [Bacillaceae bacterium CLA-AA-H227]|uniref:DUF4279 domain-containing protein n=1 Tax=Robertmurraya yapensis (ex Hitch et al 2024) TaxID=3133160 RepID=A0ACC6SH82_9BACI
MDYKNTSIEVYFALWSETVFSMAYVTDKLGIFPTYTQKRGDWHKPRPPIRPRQYNFSEWKYSTGLVETLDMPSLVDKIVQTFQDKVHIINELKEELHLKLRFQIVPYIKDGMSPSFSITPEQMQFAIDIGVVFDIDQYIYGFIEE